MHSSLLKEDLREPKELAGISDLANHGTRYFNSGRHELSPGWSANRTCIRVPRCVLVLRSRLVGS